MGMMKDLHDQVISGQEDTANLHEELLRARRNFVLSRLSLIVLLKRYLVGSVSAESIADLANALEMNERVNVDGPGDVVINNVLFELANPEINGALTEAGAMALIETLQTD